MPWPQLQAAQAFIRRGQFTMIAAGPGTGKSAFTQVLAQVGDGGGATCMTLYFSADTDSATFFKRSAAIASGWQMNDIESMMRAGADAGLEAKVASDTQHIWMDYRSSVTDQDVLDEIDAFATVYGDYPEIIVVDNLTNMYTGDYGNDREGISETCTALHDIARATGAAVIALHHVGGSYEGEPTPVPLSGVREKVTKIPEVILTLHRNGDMLNVSVVKNRNGPADASGSNYISLPVDLARMRIG